MKREVMTPGEWSKARRGSDHPPMAGIVLATGLIYFTFVGMLFLLAAVLGY